MPKLFTTLLVLACLLWSCSEGALYEKTYSPEGETWRHAEPFQYAFTIPDTNGRYTFYLDITHSVDYPFQNLYTKITTSYPDQEDVTDLLSLELSDDLGLWQGKCGKQYCKVRIPLQTNARFKTAGEYALNFEQFTRRDSLPGVKSMRLKVIP